MSRPKCVDEILSMCSRSYVHGLHFVVFCCALELQWRHKMHDGVSYHQPHDCLLNRSGADQSQHQRSASLAFKWGIHRGPVNSPYKWPVTRKMFPFDDVIMVMVKLTHIFYDQVTLNNAIYIYFKLLAKLILEEGITSHCLQYFISIFQWVVFMRMFCIFCMTRGQHWPFGVNGSYCHHLKRYE